MMVTRFQRVLRCIRMKSSSPSSVNLPESASCIVPYFCPKFASTTKFVHDPILAREYVRQIGGFDEVIDVRSPAEFEDDHIPGASEYCHNSMPHCYTPEYEPTRAYHFSPHL